jgi:hypothetical protein
MFTGVSGATQEDMFLRRFHLEGSLARSALALATTPRTVQQAIVLSLPGHQTFTTSPKVRAQQAGE